MESGLNRVELIGRLGADVTVNHLTGGGRVANLSFATDESYIKQADRQAGRQDRVAAHRHLPGRADLDVREARAQGPAGLHRRQAADTALVRTDATRPPDAGGAVPPERVPVERRLRRTGRTAGGGTTPAHSSRATARIPPSTRRRPPATRWRRSSPAGGRGSTTRPRCSAPVGPSSTSSRTRAPTSPRDQRRHGGRGSPGLV